MHAHSLTVGPYITLNGYTGIIRHVIVIEYTFTHYLIYDACLSSQNSLSSDLHFKSSFQTIRHIKAFPPIFYTIQFHSISSNFLHNSIPFEWSLHNHRHKKANDKFLAVVRRRRRLSMCFVLYFERNSVKRWQPQSDNLFERCTWNGFQWCSLEFSLIRDVRSTIYWLFWSRFTNCIMKGNVSYYEKSDDLHHERS